MAKRRKQIRSGPDKTVSTRFSMAAITPAYLWRFRKTGQFRSQAAG